MAPSLLDATPEGDTSLPCTATLIRGKTYTYKGHKYVKGAPWPVSKELALDLRDNHDIESSDSRSGERVQRPRFRIEGLDDEDDEDDGTARRPLKRAKKPSRSTR